MSGTRIKSARLKREPAEVSQRKGTVGRHPIYRQEFIHMAAVLTAKGFTRNDLAVTFGVSDATIEKWMKERPEFETAVKGARQVADSRVVRALYERATGYEHPEDDIRTLTQPDNGGSKIVITPTVKRYPPDTTAAIFWLKNRAPQEWRDKVETDVTGSIEHRVTKVVREWAKDEPGSDGS